MAVQADPAIAAEAARLRQEAQQQEQQDKAYPYGVDQLVRTADGELIAEAHVPGFTPSPGVEPLIPTPAAPQESAQEPTEAPVSYEADTSGIEDLLEAPPDLGGDDEEPDFEAAEDDEQPDFEVDPKLAKRIRQLEKKNAWLEEQRVKQGQKNWVGEAKRRFPLAAPSLDEGFQPQSRTEAMREANRIQAMVEKAIGPELEKIKAARTTAATEAQQEARTHAQKAWGQPTVGPPQPMIDAAEANAEADRLDRRNFKSLEDLLKAKFRAGQQAL